MLIYLRLFLAAALLMGLASCKTPAQKAEQEKKADELSRQRDQVQDDSFKAFVGRLRKAVANKDIRVMSTMMTADFGYSWAPGSDGYGCFKYWDDNQLWPELQRVVNSQFLPNGNFLVAPPEFAADPNYTGFRAGIKREKGSYKFAYFVPAQETPMAAPPAQGN
ncbi:MAG: hypothetical protein ABIT76_07815 [Chthoniobacterales bacterium]